MRLIDLDEFLRQNCVDRMDGKSCEECKHHVLAVSCERLMEQPTIDPVKEAFDKLLDEDTNGIALIDDQSGKRVDYFKVKHGRWVKHDLWTKPVCSVCGEPCFGLHGFSYETTDYCPYCGARMEGEAVRGIDDDPSHPFADGVMMKE